MRDISENGKIHGKDLGTLLTDVLPAKIREAAERAATSEMNVLILGETGVGKEVLARGIHRASSNRSSAFIAVNCSAIPNALFESELFGHVKGAFTGATCSRKGFATLADEGTLFLDEITDLLPENQSKLLRLIEIKRFYPVGAEKEQKSTFRLITASNKSLHDISGGAHLRRDLFYRIGGFIIEIPPLRDRKDIILQLSSHFIQEQGIEAKLSSRALEFMLCYPFPGNIRELKHLIEYAVSALDGQDTIDLIHFPDAFQRYCHHLLSGPDRKLSDIVRCFSCAYIHNLVDEHKTSVDNVVHMLGISRATVYRLLNKGRQ